MQGQGATSFGVFCAVPEIILEEVKLFGTGASGMMGRLGFLGGCFCHTFSHKILISLHLLLKHSDIMDLDEMLSEERGLPPLLLKPPKCMGSVAVRPLAGSW